jgi:hypothetical protein
MPARRFPPPSSVEEYNDACFIVRDNSGQQLGYVYFEDEPGRRSAAKLRGGSRGKSRWFPKHSLDPQIGRMTAEVGSLRQHIGTDQQVNGKRFLLK